MKKRKVSDPEKGGVSAVVSDQPPKRLQQSLLRKPPQGGNHGGHHAKTEDHIKMAGEGVTKKAKTSWPPFVPLITCENDIYSVHPEAIEFLNSVGGPLAIVSTVGKYRTGKSWLSNQVLLQCKSGEGFIVGGTTRACTKGLLLATKVLKIAQDDGSKLQTLVIDTEGIGSLNASSTHDSRIFALAMLHSSLLLYNSVGPIDEAALENLSLVTNITKEIRLSSDNNTAVTEGTPNSNEPANAIANSNASQENVIRNDSELRNYFPSLLWVLRDFGLKMVDDNNNAITSNQYLEHALAHQVAGNVKHDLKEDGGEKEVQGGTEQEKQKNRIRKTLRTFFPDRACVQLGRPSNSEAEVDMADRSKLRPEFLNGLSQLHSTIVGGIKPKLVGGKPISGPIFAKMCQSFVNAINSNTVPVVRDVWEMLSKDRCAEAWSEALGTWETCERDLARELELKSWLPQTVLQGRIEAGKQKARAVYENKAIRGEHDTEFATRLDALMEDRQKALVKLNLREMKTHVRTKVIAKLQPLVKAADFAALRQVYEEESTKHSSFEKSEWASLFHEWLWESAEAICGRLSEKLQHAEKAPAQLQDQLQQLRQHSQTEDEDKRLEIKRLESELKRIETEREAFEKAEAEKRRAEAEEKRAAEKQAEKQKKEREEQQKAELWAETERWKAEQRQWETERRQLTEEKSALQLKWSLSQRETMEERAQREQTTAVSQQSANEHMEKMVELQMENKRLSDEVEAGQVVQTEMEELRAKMQELESDKATAQQEHAKLENDLRDMDEEFEQQLTRLKQEWMEGMCELKENHNRKHNEWQGQMRDQRLQAEAEMGRLNKQLEQLAAKRVADQSLSRETQEQLTKSKEQGARLGEQLARSGEHVGLLQEQLAKVTEQLSKAQEQVTETKKTAEQTLDRVREKNSDEMRQQRDQTSKDQREWAEKEMTLAQKLQFAEHRYESAEARLSDVQKRWTGEASVRASEKLQLAELPRLKDKIIRLETQNKSLKDQQASSNQLLRQATDRVSLLERQSKDRERKQEVAVASAQLLMTRQHLLGVPSSSASSSSAISSSLATSSGSAVSGQEHSVSSPVLCGSGVESPVKSRNRWNADS